MPSNIVLRNLTPETKMGNESPKIATRASLRDGARGDSGIVVPPSEPLPSNLIFMENFESGLQPGSELTNGAEVVASSNFGGNFACRVNLKDDANDPKIASPSNAATYEYNGTLLRDTQSDVVTVEWQFRFDDAQWNGSLESITSSSGVVLKGGFFGAYQNKVNGFYPVLKGGPNGSINLGDNGGRGDGGWQNALWANDPGRLLWYLRTGHEWGAGTGVHTFRVTVDHSHPDYQQLRMWVDGNLATSSAYAADGIIRLPKTWRFESFSTCYTNDGNVDLATDGSETACGIEFNHIRIYEGEGA